MRKKKVTKVIDVEIGPTGRKVRSDAKIDAEQAFKMRKSGMGWKEIADALKKEGEPAVHPITVSRAVKRIASDTSDLFAKNYSRSMTKRNRESILAEKHIMALEAITPNKLKEASAKDNAMTSKMLHEQWRLENNKSTKNIAVSFAQLVEQVEDSSDDYD